MNITEQTNEQLWTRLRALERPLRGIPREEQTRRQEKLGQIRDELARRGIDFAKGPPALSRAERDRQRAEWVAEHANDGIEGLKSDRLIRMGIDPRTHSARDGEEEHKK